MVGAASLLQPRLGGRAAVAQRAGAAADGGGRSVKALGALEAVVVAALPVHPAVAVLPAAALPAAAAQQPQQEAAQQQQPPPPRHRPALPVRPGGARRGRPRVRSRVRGLPPPPDPAAPPPRGRSRPRRAAPRSPAAPRRPARPRTLGGGPLSALREPTALPPRQEAWRQCLERVGKRASVRFSATTLLFISLPLPGAWYAHADPREMDRTSGRVGPSRGTRLFFGRLRLSPPTAQ